MDNSTNFHNRKAVLFVITPQQRQEHKFDYLMRTSRGFITRSLRTILLVLLFRDGSAQILFSESGALMPVIICHGLCPLISFPSGKLC